MRQLTVVTLALLIALVVASGLILAYGQSPARVYAVMLSHTWGDWHGFGQVLFKATPLVFTGIAVALAYRAGLFNVGAEGQLLVGSFATALVGSALPTGLPWPLGILPCAAAGAAAGGLLGALPGALKARLGAHEVITTIMLNFIVAAFVLGAGRRWFFVAETVHTHAVAASARLPGLGLAGSAASLAFPIAVAVAVAAHVFLHHTARGFELRAVGAGPEAARAAGISVGPTVIGVMTLSGALAGLVGTGTVLGYKGYFEEGMGSGTGFMGIAVALLAGAEPLAVIVAALWFGTLAQGGLAANGLVPKELIEVVQGVIILAVSVASAELRRAGRS